MRVEIKRNKDISVYEVPVVQGMKVMDVLDYIYANLDHTFLLLPGNLRTLCLPFKWQNHSGVCGNSGY